MQHPDNDPRKYAYALDQSSAVTVAGSDGRILYVNDLFLKMYGYTRAEVIGKDHRILNSGHHPPDLMALLWQAVSSGQVWQHTLRNKRSDGHFCWVDTTIVPLPDDSGKVYQYFTISRDVTSGKEKEERQENMLSYLRTSIESYKDVLIFSLDAELRYLLFNESFKAATQYAYGTVIVEGMSMPESISKDEDREKARYNCSKALAGESHTTLEVYGDLNRVFYETKYTPIVDHDGLISGVTVLSADVTERVLAEERAFALHKELEMFSYSVAHDLRAPLRSVNGFAQILKEDYATRLDSEGIHLIDVIRSNALKMGRLIDDLLSFSRLERQELQYRRVDMNGLMQNVIRDLELSEPHQARIQLGDLPVLQGDYNLLQQAMHNLVSNAIKFSSAKEQPLVEIRAEQKGNDLVFSIKDNGVGFDMNYYDKLFGIFHRLHGQNEFEGTGIGLALTQRIIRKHGGEVWAQAQVNEGATFFFRLTKAKDFE